MVSPLGDVLTMGGVRTGSAGRSVALVALADGVHPGSSDAHRWVVCNGSLGHAVSDPGQPARHRDSHDTEQDYLSVDILGGVRDVPRSVVNHILDISDHLVGPPAIA